MKSKGTITWLTTTPIRLAIPRNAMKPNGETITAKQTSAPDQPVWSRCEHEERFNGISAHGQHGYQFFSRRLVRRGVVLFVTSDLDVRGRHSQSMVATFLFSQCTMFIVDSLSRYLWKRVLTEGPQW